MVGEVRYFNERKLICPRENKTMVIYYLLFFVLESGLEVTFKWNQFLLSIRIDLSLCQYYI